MKFFGQNIQDFISRFRNDVFLESISSGTIASGGNLGLDSNNKIVKAAVSGGTTNLTSDVTGVLPVANGGTGASSLTDNAVLLGNSTGVVEASAHLNYSNSAPGGGVDIDQFTIGDSNSTASELLSSAATPLTIKPGSSSGTNVAGAALNLHGGISTGNTAGGSIRFLSSVTGSSGSSSNSTAEIASFDNVGNLQIDGGITVGSTSFVNNSGVVQVATQGTIDHDSLANFVAAEHYRWDTDISSTATINAANIPTLNQNTTGSAATLTNARDFRVDLTSTSAVSFNGSSDVSPGVTGTLAVANGGTGNTDGLAVGLTASTSNSIGVGSIELGHASDTTIARSASGIITVEGKQVRTADRQIQATYSSFSADDIDTKHYIAFNDGDSENTNTTNVDLPIVAPFAGKLLRVNLRCSRNISSHTMTFRLETQAVGVSFGTGPTIVGTQSGAGCSNTSMTTYDFTTSLDSGDNLIDAGDAVYLSIQSNSSAASSKYYITCIWEWDYSSL